MHGCPHVAQFTNCVAGDGRLAPILQSKQTQG
jgi:hypothetical protein